MPSYQGMEFLARVLAALARQKTDFEWDVLVVDSGSTDGTWELLGEAQAKFPVPFRRSRIHKVEFNHGDTRNYLAAMSSGDLLVFLTQDAIPSSDAWLQTLVANFDDENVGAAYCRNVPRPDAHKLTKVFSVGDPGYATERREVRLPDAETYAGLSTHEKRILYNFNDVASAVRRELWELHPFPRTPFGEDILMSRGLLEAGYTVVYDADATVEHSHDYDAAETYARCWIDAKFNIEWLNRVCVATRADAETLTERVVTADIQGIDTSDLADNQARAILNEARALRRAAFHGLHDGGQSTRRYPATKMLSDRHLSVLFVVHGFPPDTWAGTEIYTFNLAKELARRGHRCTILARVPVDSSEPCADFEVEESEFQGLRVLRLTNSLDYADMRETFEQPAADEAFRALLEREDFDVVHFQHLLHTSVGLVAVAKSKGLATVVTCHDYWSICARVQLIRPDGTLCHGNMGSGCFFCVKERGTEHIDRAAALDEAGGDLPVQFVKEVLAKTGPDPAWRKRLRDYVTIRRRENVVPEAYAACDLQISPSRFLREKLLESGRFDADRFLYSDNGMRTDHITALRKDPDPAGRIRFGFVGSLVWYKGDDVMLKAMQRLAGEPVCLRVFGDFRPEADAHHAELQKLADAAGNVEFRGRFDNAKLSEVYAEIDVLVVPSIWFENSPITIHEAYLTETPVLASDIGGMAEYVRDGVDGLHFRVGDDEDLARKMARFVHEPELLHALSQDFIPIKTIAENAAEMEFRYRALVCRERSTHPSAAGPSHLQLRGIDADTTGEAVQQGADMLLLTSPGSAAEYELSGLRSGAYELRIDFLALAGEHDIMLSGRIMVDGEERRRVVPFRAMGSDERRSFSVRVAVSDGAPRVRIEHSGDGGTVLRICALTAEEVAGGAH